jgi:hypothetical protein
MIEKQKARQKEVGEECPFPPCTHPLSRNLPDPQGPTFNPSDTNQASLQHFDSSDLSSSILEQHHHLSVSSLSLASVNRLAATREQPLGAIAENKDSNAGATQVPQMRRSLTMQDDYSEPYQLRPRSAMTDGGAINLLQAEEESKCDWG